jgi:hypothetical protein
LRGHKRDQQEGFWIGVHEESNQGVQRVAEDERLESMEGSTLAGARKQGSDIVERSAPSRTEEEPNSTTGNASIRRKKKDLWMMVETWTN